MDMIDEDGGIIKTVNVNAPKIIKSTQIVIFECEFSTPALLDLDADTGNCIYILEARLENKFVNGSFHHHSRDGKNVDDKFKAEQSFIERLQRIIRNIVLRNTTVYALKLKDCLICTEQS